MLPNHPPRAGLRSLVKRDLLLKPRAFYHTGLVIFLMAHGTFHHIPHAINQPRPKAAAAFQLHRHRRFRNKFWFGGHDGAPRSRLRQFVPRPGFHCLILQPRQNHQFHKLFNESALPGAHRANHTNIDIASGAAGNVSIQASGFHGHSPLFLHHHGHQQPHILLQSRPFQPVALLNGVW